MSDYKDGMRCLLAPIVPSRTSLGSADVQRAQGCPGLTQAAAEQPLTDSVCVACHFLQPQNTAAYHIAGSNTTCIVNLENKGFLAGFPKEMGVQ